MSILVIGLSHRTAPVPVLERVALAVAEVPQLLGAAIAADNVAEAVVIATCNRVELYADVDRFHGGVSALCALLAEHAGLSAEAITPHLYVHYEARAVQHLFEVSSGLDSMVVGEHQILGQVRQSLRLAQDCGSAGRILNELFQAALRVGKRVRTDTGIDRAGRSLVSAGLELASRDIGGVAGRRALVVGAGSLSALAATTLARLGIGSVTIANRTPQHAARVAEAVGGRAIPLAAIEDALAETDVLVSCTGSVGVVVDADLVRRARSRRRLAGDAGDLAVLDLALPRDVDPAVRDLPGVSVLDLEALGAALQGEQAAEDVGEARRIVAAEVEDFLAWERASSVAPTVVALRTRAAQVVEAELARLTGRLPDLDDRSRDEVAQAVRRVVDKLLHAPTVRVKELADEPGGVSYAAVLRELFDLGPAPVAVLERVVLEEPLR